MARRSGAGLLGERVPTLLLLGAGVLLGIWMLIAPLFGPLAPDTSAADFVNHVALVAAALDTLQTTAGVPISSDKLVPGVEYPYFLFGNTAFYALASSLSLILQVPAYLGAGSLLSLAFALGAGGMFAVARGGGLARPLAVALGLLYAAGPYLSVNLLVRAAFPEYLLWQLVPVLVLVVSRGARPSAGPWAMLAGALALATPFYVHKLIAAHVALTLAALALNSVPASRASLARLWVTGLVAICLSVPAWYPLLLWGLDAEVVAGVGGGPRPAVLHQTWIDLFWPWAQNSLVAALKEEVYGERFALQVGLVPTTGLLLSLAVLLTRPGAAIAQRLVLPLLLFAAYSVLIMGASDVWAVLPSPLSYLQFTYRLLGIVHLVGFVLLINALGGPARRPARAGARPLLTAAVVLLVALSTASVSTYWRHAGLLPLASAEIRPNDLRDYSGFWPRTERTGRILGQALTNDGRLAIPPRPIAVSGALPSIVVAGEVGPGLSPSRADPLVVRVYGFRRQAPDAELEELVGLFRHRRGRPYPIAPIHELIERERRESRRARSTVAAGRPLAIPDLEWSVLRLAEATLVDAGRFELRVSTDQPVDALAVECSRAVDVPQEYAGWTSDRPTCVGLDQLAAVGEAATPYFHPLPIGRARQTRGAHGTTTVDARGLGPGDYLMPTFHYRFVRVHASDGTEVPVSAFDRRTAIHHGGGDEVYTVSYALGPTLLAALAGVALWAAYAGLAHLSSRRRRASDP